MNWQKILGIILIVLAGIEMFRITSDYLSGKLASWPLGVEVGAGLMVWLGVFLIRRGNRKKDQAKL